jgi:long-chain fatty acid transport protein
MGSKGRLLAAAAASAAIMALGQPAHATNGYFITCVGAYNCGMAGAGVALPTDATNAGVNPALMARVGNEAILSPAWFHPVRTIDAKGPLGNSAAGEQTSSNEHFVEGAAGVNYTLNPTFSLGASLYGSGGMMTKYDQPRINPAFLPSPGGAYDNEVRYRIGNLVPTLSARPTKDSAYGIGVILAYSDFKTNFATAPFNFRTQGNLELDQAFGVGVRVGGLWDVSPALTLGATVSTPVWFEEFGKYRDVFLGPVNTPPHGTIGLAWHVTPSTDIAFDVKYIAYETVKAIGKQPAQGGFGWENMPVFMLGAQHRLNESLTLRAGYNYGPSPIPENNTFANALFPAVMEHHVAAGLTYALSPRWQLTGSAFYAFKAEQTDPGTGDVYSQNGVGTHVDMYQMGVQFAVKWTF